MALKTGEQKRAARKPTASFERLITTWKKNVTQSQSGIDQKKKTPTETLSSKDLLAPKSRSFGPNRKQTRRRSKGLSLARSFYGAPNPKREVEKSQGESTPNCATLK